MLEELSAKNLLSFRDEVCLSFEATNDTMGEEQMVTTMPDGKRLLRLAMIYGANASGKTNVLMALEWLKRYWDFMPQSIDRPTGCIPFRFDPETPKQPTEVTLRFYANGKRYWYTLCADEHQVIEEKLSFYTSTRPTMLFHRAMEKGRLQLTVNPAVNKLSDVELQQLQINCFDNMSFFAARGRVNIVLPYIDDAREWMRMRVMSPVEPGLLMFDYAKKEMETNPALVPYLLEQMKTGDFNITGLKTERQGTADMIQATFEHTVNNARGEEKYLLGDELESRGTRRVLGIESAIYNARHRNALLPIDEIESSLHPALIEQVLYDFLQTGGESQLLVTTHYDYLLDLVNDLIRKDCVWFTEKGKDGATSLYSLAEFAGINKLSSLQRAYRGGRFGATPNI